jgi:3-deoxy-D-manno-octulosonic-acid transferase
VELTSIPGHAVPMGAQLKWALFGALEELSEVRARLRGTTSAAPRPADTGLASERYLWVFATTIGELEAIDPFLRRLVQRLANLRLVLLSDHEHYREGFLFKYPGALFRVIDHRSAHARDLANELPPALLLLAEIPCLLSDAPCRFPFALAFEAKRCGAPVCLVNGWLYQQQPSCLMDWIEKRLFERDYLGLFDVMTVQDESTRRTLVAAGAHRDRVFVTGNIKFDALAAGRWDVRAARSGALLEAITASGRPVLTAGCVTNVEEQKLVLDAFGACLSLPGNPLLVVAPRHPENAERMEILKELLQRRGYRFALKSRLQEQRVQDSYNCLVVDTLGELKDFYAISTFTYVGLNKNVLEPLTFGKQVFVTSGWDRVRPGFPVYELLRSTGFITEVPRDALAAAFRRAFTTTVGADFRASGEYAELAGAADRCLACLDPILDQLEQRTRAETPSRPEPDRARDTL